MKEAMQKNLMESILLCYNFLWNKQANRKGFS